MAKSKWETQIKDKLILVEDWARNGLTDEQIANNLGISKTTFYKYKKEHSELSELLKKGKEVIDTQVENALLKRALGYTYEEQSTETFLNGNVKKKTITKHIPGDTTAQIFWLKNRRPDKWRDKNVVEHQGELTTTNPLSGLTTEELRNILKKEK